MKVIYFAKYYIKFRLAVLFGRHETRNPLSMRWRWKFWNSQQKRFQIRLF